MRLGLLAITAVALCAQSLEIRGTVVEYGLGTPLAGVEVTLTVSPREKPRELATVFTDANGNFVFKPEVFGQYQVDAKKSGFAPPRGMFQPNTAFISAEFPVWQSRLMLMNPSRVTGRFVDAEDRPIGGLRVSLREPQSGILTSEAVTGSDGTFTATNVVPGSYLVRLSPTEADLSKLEEYSDEAFERTDRGYEDLVWPTGVPFVVPSGGVSNIGTMHLRQADRYRVRLNIQGDCSGVAWQLRLIDLQQNSFVSTSAIRAGCKRQLLLTNVPAGSYQFALWSDDDNIRWTTSSFLITRSNTTLNLTLAAATDVPGRIVTSEGVPLPAFTGTGFQLMMRPDIVGISESDAQEPQVLLDGSFIAHSLRWNRYRISAPRVPAPYYVREVRYNGRPVIDGRIDLFPNAKLEFELDNQPARVSGTLIDGTAILLAKAPYDLPTAVQANTPFSYLSYSRNGQFVITGVAPGEYRIAAALDASQLSQLIQSAQKITLKRGEQQTVKLRIGP